MTEPGSEFFGSMAYNHDNGFDTTPTQVVNTSFDDSILTEGKQRFERAHPV